MGVTNVTSVGKEAYSLRVFVTFDYERMRAKGVGSITSSAPRTGGSPVRPGLPKAAIRLRPETWQLLAALRRPLLDPEGNLVALESFDRLVRRLLEERRTLPASRPRLQEARP